MKKMTALAVLGLLGLAALAVRGDDKEAEKQSLLMRKKLECSQNILEGLALEDYDAMAENARVMKGLTQLEHWFRADSPQYKAQLNIFWFANDELIRLADEKNMEGASLAYMQLTLSCVNCHKHIRDKAQ